MLLGLESFSYHLALGSGNMDCFGFIRRVHELGLDGVQLNMVGRPPLFGHLGGVDAEHLRQIRALVEELGLYIEIDTNQSDITNLERGLNVCEAVGSKILRTYQIPENSVIDTDKAVRILQEIEPRCRETGVRIAFENHEFQTAGEVLEIVRRVDSEWIGAFCDNGNGMMMWENPDETVEKLAPHAFTNHFKDHVIIEENGQPIVAGVTLGQGSMDLQKHFRMLAQSMDHVNIEVCYAYRAPFRMPQEHGAGATLGAGAFAIIPGPFDGAFIPPAQFEITPQILEWENQSVVESVEYVKRLREEC